MKSRDYFTVESEHYSETKKKLPASCGFSYQIPTAVQIPRQLVLSGSHHGNVYQHLIVLGKWKTRPLDIAV